MHVLRTVHLPSRRRCVCTATIKYRLLASLADSQLSFVSGVSVTYQAYATVKYESFTPEVSSIHAMLTVNGKVGTAFAHVGADVPRSAEHLEILNFRL